MSSGHLQTLYNIRQLPGVDQIWYRRQLLRLSDGGTLGLDFALAGPHSPPDDAPIIVVQHGMTGGSHEPYVRAILAPACRPIERGGLGYRAVVVTFRGCGGVPVTSPQLYTAGHTEDLRQALVYIAHRYPQAPLLGLGFSLGANTMTRYVAEEGIRSRLSSVVVLGCPWDMEENCKALEGTFFGKNFWARAMGVNLQNILRRHEKILAQSTIAEAVHFALVLNYPTLSTFDNVYTRISGDSIAPFPFPTVSQYHRWASSHDLLEDIKVPFIAINSEDDPLVRVSPVYDGGNPNVILVTTRRGGHLGWFKDGENGVERWITKPIIEWFQLMGGEILHQKSAFFPISVDNNGFLAESGNGYLRCKEIDGGGLIDGSAGDQGVIEGLKKLYSNHLD